jgi:histidinol phosphatase-like PHP family hydrolase
MRSRISRRDVLALGAAAAASAFANDASIPVRGGVPRVDYHAHPEEGMTVDRALALSKERGVLFGLVEHAGVKQGASSHLVGNDDELKTWIRSLAGKPVYAGIQAELTNWMSAFSKDVVAQLDYVLSDALTMPDKSGKLVKMWTPAFQCDDPQDFMDRYVDFYVAVMAKEPIDILANPTFLPEMLEPQYDTLWTERRMQTVVDAAKKYGIAIEINSRYRVPRLAFLQIAKAAGLKFSFGSNMHTAEGIGQIDYCVEMYRKLALPLGQFFRPAPAGKKPIQTRTLA